MSIARTTEPITASDHELRKALEDAHLPSLLPALAQTTGDMGLLREDLRPAATFPAGDQGGMPPQKQAEARELAFQVLRRFRDGGSRETTGTTEDDIRKMLEFVTAGGMTEQYLPLLLEELAFNDQDTRAPNWKKESIKGDTPFEVAIIGAGMSGILAAVRLKQAGVPFTIYEKNADVGGTWLENTYPGARVDVSNHLYSYSFAQKLDWPQHFSTQESLLEYFRDCANEFEIRDRIRFNTEVTSATWNEAESTWELDLTSEGTSENVRANALISAVGQLNRPKMPEITGMTSFEGPSFHSARWDHSVDLAGKRVAVIGTGASASQFVPEIAQNAGEVFVFQRTPNWYIPVPHYHDPVPDGLKWLFLHVPHYAHWYRFWLFWSTADGLLPMAKVDNDRTDRSLAVGAQNEMLRAMLSGYLMMELNDRPDLLQKCIPQYPPASKRIVLDNGAWARTLKRENVHLVTDAIAEINPRGVVVEGGKEYPADVIVYATGFQASKFLTPMKVTGRNGTDLHEQWAGDARAYMGITIPNFPNFFVLYGPNTNIVVNGSIIYFSECEVQYVLGCIRTLLAQGHRAMDVRKDVHDEYNVRIDKGNLQMAWGVSTVNSWYKSESGRVAQNWPFSLLEYWQQTREPNPADYVFT